MDMVPRAASRVRNLGFAAVAVFAAYTTFLVVSDDEPLDADAWIYVGVSVAVAAVIWILAVARPLARETGNTPALVGLVFGIVGVLANVAFWAGFNGFLGAAAIALGIEGTRRARRGDGRAGMAKAATILGGISVAAFVVFWIGFGIAELT
jgi:hypothetical protein